MGVPRTRRTDPQRMPPAVDPLCSTRGENRRPVRPINGAAKRGPMYFKRDNRWHFHGSRKPLAFLPPSLCRLRRYETKGGPPSPLNGLVGAVRLNCRQKLCAVENICACSLSPRIFPFSRSNRFDSARQCVPKKPFVPDPWQRARSCFSSLVPQATGTRCANRVPTNRIVGGAFFLPRGQEGCFASTCFFCMPSRCQASACGPGHLLSHGGWGALAGLLFFSGTTTQGPNAKRADASKRV